MLVIFLLILPLHLYVMYLFFKMEMFLLMEML